MKELSRRLSASSSQSWSIHLLLVMAASIFTTRSKQKTRCAEPKRVTGSEATVLKGSGRFNVTLGAIATAVGIGAALSQAIAGAIVHHSSFNTGFLCLAAIAAAAFGIFYFFMPEIREKSFLNEHP